MLVQGTLDSANNVVIPSKPLVWVDGGGGSTGAVDDPAWSGTGDGSLVSILKAIYAQNEDIKILLNDIKTNTTTP